MVKINVVPLENHLKTIIVQLFANSHRDQCRFIAKPKLSKEKCKVDEFKHRDNAKRLSKCLYQSDNQP